MKVLVGMSGGLDSTFAAHLLLEEGHEVEGALLKMSDSTSDAEAKEACRSLGIPLHIIDCKSLFERNVIDNFVSEYCRARTPNPCVVCNPYVKFAALCEYAEAHGFDKIATGHYAFAEQADGRYFIRCADFESKDQSYVLWGLSQRQLASLVFPLSNKSKSDIREQARLLGYAAADSKESQEICFIPDGDYAGYIEKRTGRVFPEGDFVDADGNTVGRHRGIINYTVGQRKGLNLSLGHPVFVTRLDCENNRVVVGEAGSEFNNSLFMEKLNFQKLTPGEYSIDAQIKIRYAAKPVPARISTFEKTDENGNTFFCAKADFYSPVRAVTPGQSAVVYSGRDLLFGGVISADNAVLG